VRAWSEKFVSKTLDEKGNGLDTLRVVMMGSGGTSGMVTDVSETFRLDILKCEVVEGAYRNHYSSFAVTLNSSIVKLYVQQLRKVRNHAFPIQF
jgi:hypothetical protein